VLPLSLRGGTSLLAVQGPGAAAMGREQARGIKAVASYRTPKRPRCSNRVCSTDASPIFRAARTLILVAASGPHCEN